MILPQSPDVISLYISLNMVFVNGILGDLSYKGNKDKEKRRESRYRVNRFHNLIKKRIFYIFFKYAWFDSISGILYVSLYKG